MATIKSRRADMLEKIIGSQSRAEIFRKLFTKDAPTFYLRKSA